MTGLPPRIQLSRRKGWRMPEGAVKVDRSTIWGNPFTFELLRRAIPDLPDHLLQTISCSAFLSWLTSPEDDMLVDISWLSPEVLLRRQMILARLPELRGRPLACWCPLDCHCHADVLIELANGGGEE